MYTDINTLDLWNQPDEGDPLVWLRRHRDELAQKYPTIEQLSDYYRTVPSWEEIKAKLQRDLAAQQMLIEETANEGY
ncbi:MAG: hypothetical protein ACRC10_05035 [Thermoguttaceae bacterium]